MKTWLRKLRGILGIGATWGLVGGVVGTVGGAVALLFGLPVLETLLIAGLGGTALGFVIGGGFASILSLMDGRRSLEQLSPARSAMWGASAGVLSMVLMTLMGGGPEPLYNFLLASGVFGGIGAGMAAGTVLLARRSLRQLPETGDETGALSAGDASDG